MARSRDDQQSLFDHPDPEPAWFRRRHSSTGTAAAQGVDVAGLDLDTPGVSIPVRTGPVPHGPRPTTGGARS